MIRVIKWLAGRVLRLVPERLRSRLLPAKFRFDPSRRPLPIRAPDALVRLFIAPVNYAGQGWQWARAVERHIPNAGAVNMMVRTPNDFGHPADQVVPLGFYAASTKWQHQQRDAVTAGFTHVMIEAEKHPFGGVLDESVEAQARHLQSHGVGVLMLCHGSDIRVPSQHIKNFDDSPFLDSLKAIAPTLERVARRNRRVLDRVGAPILVSTPDLLLDVPQATWLPVVVDIALWKSSAPVLTRKVPIVVHAPSNGSVKGSELIDPVLQRLHTEGIVEYRRIEKVPFSRMATLYREADIVLDQFRLGDYGVAACEAMAAGRVVVANVSEHARERAAAASGMPLPVIQATASSVEEVLREVVRDRSRAQSVADAGVAFVERLHDGRQSAAVLGGFLS